MQIFEKMIAEYDYVQKNAKHVFIDFDVLDKFCKHIEVKKNVNWIEEVGLGFENLSKKQMLNFLLLFNSMNFSYFGNPKWCINYNGKNYDGSIGVIAAFARSFKYNFNMLDFRYVKDISYDEFKKFMQGNLQIPMCKERYENITETAKVVSGKMNSNFCDYIKDAKNDAKLFEIIINNFESFEDVSIYNGKAIHFYKRAQLLVSDILHYMKKCGDNVSYNNIIGAADYKIPQVLRNFGIIKYDEYLSKLVDNYVPIKKDCNYEIEIRAITLYVINYISKRLGKYPSFEINDAIWLEGQKLSSNAKPYHRTRTASY